MNMQVHNSFNGELTSDSVSTLSSHTQLQASRNNTAAKKLLNQNVSTLKRMESKEIVAISCQQKRILKDIQKVKNRSRDVDEWLEESRRRTVAKRSMEYDQIQRRISRMKQVASSWKPPGGASSTMTSRGNLSGFNGYDKFGHFQRSSDRQFGTMTTAADISMKGQFRKTSHGSLVPQLPAIPEVNSNSSSMLNTQSVPWSERNLQRRRSSEASSFQAEKRPSLTSDTEIKNKPKNKFYLLGLAVGKLASKSSLVGKGGKGRSSKGKSGSSSNSRRSSVDGRRKSIDIRRTSVDSRRSSLESWKRVDKTSQRRRKRSLVPSDRRDINHLSTKGFHLFDYRSQLLNLGTQGDVSSDSDESVSSFEED